MILFRILLAIDSVAGLIILYFFFLGLGDGSVSSFNIGVWLVILLILTAIFAGSLYLKSSKRLKLPNLLLAFLGVPALLFGLFFLMMILSGARWN